MHRSFDAPEQAPVTRSRLSAASILAWAHSPGSALWLLVAVVTVGAVVQWVRTGSGLAAGLGGAGVLVGAIRLLRRVL